MSVSGLLLQTVRDAVRENLPAGLHRNEVEILPEGRVHYSSGQRSLTISPVDLRGITPKLEVRKRLITFSLTLSQRVRDIPNDRFDTIAYTDVESMATVLENLIPVIETEELFLVLKAKADQILIPHTSTPMYQWSDTFRFISMNLDPRHLYPSDFGTRSGNDKKQLYDKIAGFSITAVFEGPVYQLTNSGISC